MALSNGVTIRVATPDDAGALRSLATLDGARRLTGHVLLAEVGDLPVAAVSLETGALVTDPFRTTADLVRVLRLRRYQLTRQGGHRPLPSSRHLTRQHPPPWG
jgi:hypothetical protein